MKRKLLVAGLIVIVLFALSFAAEMNLFADAARTRGIDEPSKTCFNTFEEDKSNKPIISWRRCRGCVVLPVLNASDSDTCELQNEL